MEIVTLQFGNLTNHVMTHYWNIQDEKLKNPEIQPSTEMYELDHKEGYYPFTIFFDRKDMFGNYFGCFNEERIDPLEAQDDIINQWQGGYIVNEQDYIEKSEFANALDGIDEEIEAEKHRKQQEQEEQERYSSMLLNKASSDNRQNMFAEFLKASMQHEEEDKKQEEAKEESKEPEKCEDLYRKFKFDEGNIRYFTDYLQPQLSPKSRIEIPYHQGSWSIFSEGGLMLQDKYLLEDVTDQFRNMLEKTDNMQALRVLADIDCGFGSFAAKYIEEIKDEIPKKTIVLYSLTGPDVNTNMFTDERQSITKELRSYNLPFAVASFNELVNANIPIDLNYQGQIKRFGEYITDFKGDSLFNTSSIPALALNDFWAPLRSRKPAHTVDTILNPLVMFDKANIILNNIKVPFIKEPEFSGGINKMFEENQLEECWTKKEFIHLSSPFWGPLQKSKPYHIQMNWSGSVHNKFGHAKVLDQARDYCNEKFGCYNINLIEERTLLPIPFPRFLSPKFNCNGELAHKDTKEFMNNISTLSSLYCTGDIGMIIENVFLKTVKNIPYKHRQQFIKEDYMEEDDLIETREKMQNIADAYMD